MVNDSYLAGSDDRQSRAWLRVKGAYLASSDDRTQGVLCGNQQR